MKWKTVGMFLGAVALSVSLGGFALNTVSAQGGNGGGQGGNPTGGGPVVMSLEALACSTTDYDQVAATALNIKPEELRVAFVSGQSLTDLAKSKSVDIATVQKAIETARSADIDQAVKDGLLTQAQADAIKQMQALRDQMTGDGRGRMGIGIGFGRMGMGDGLYASNVEAVNAIQVAAKAINVSCVDLVKELQAGKTIVAAATAKNVTAGTVLDALVKAYKDALDQDVKEGLITAAQATARAAQLAERASQELNRGLGLRGMIGSLPQLPRNGDNGPRGNGPKGVTTPVPPVPTAAPTQSN